MDAPFFDGLDSPGAPRVVRDLPEAEYHALPGVSSTLLRDVLDVGPYLADVKRREGMEQSAAMRLGSVVHAMALTPDACDEVFVVSPPIDAKKPRNTKAWREFVAEVPAGVLALTTDEFAKARMLADRVIENPDAAAMLDGADCELSILWQDATTGLDCRARLDAHALSIGAVADLKVTVKASPLQFQRAFADRRYHVQAAFYLDAAVGAGLDASAAAYIAVQSDAPASATHAIWTYEIPDEVLAVGRTLYRRALDMWAAYQQRGGYDAYESGIVTLEMPRWAMKEAA